MNLTNHGKNIYNFDAVALGIERDYWDGLQSMDTVYNKSNCYKTVLLFPSRKDTIFSKITAT